MDIKQQKIIYYIDKSNAIVYADSYFYVYGTDIVIIYLIAVILMSAFNYNNEIHRIRTLYEKCLYETVSETPSKNDRVTA